MPLESEKCSMRGFGQCHQLSGKVRVGLEKAAWETVLSTPVFFCSTDTHNVYILFNYCWYWYWYDFN